MRFGFFFFWYILCQMQTLSGIRYDIYVVCPTVWIVLFLLAPVFCLLAILMFFFPLWYVLAIHRICQYNELMSSWASVFPLVVTPEWSPKEQKTTKAIRCSFKTEISFFSTCQILALVPHPVPLPRLATPCLISIQPTDLCQDLPYNPTDPFCTASNLSTQPDLLQSLALWVSLISPYTPPQPAQVL